MSSDTGVVFTFTWKIVNFSLNSLKCGEYFESPVFHIENLKGTTWFLQLYPEGYYKIVQDYISFFLYNNYAYKKHEGFLFSFTLEITDSHYNILKCSRYERCAVTNRGLGNLKFLTVDELANYMKNWKEDTLWIRCHFSDPNYKNVTTLCDARTILPVKTCSYKWKIKISNSSNWSKLIKFPFQDKTQFEINLTICGEYICFEIENSDMLDLNATYKLEFSVLKDNNDGVIMINPTYLFESTNGNRFLKFKSSVWIKNIVDDLRLLYMHPFTLICVIRSSSGRPTSSTIERYWFDNTVEEINQTFTDPCSVLQKDLLNLSNNKLCDLKQQAQEEIEQNPKYTPSPCSSLQNDLRNLLSNKKHCDLKLQAQGKIVPAHRSILCARSPVFSAMFERDMIESQTGTVDIADVETEPLMSFLEFLYTDTLTNTESDHVLKLILVADKYQVNILKERCSEILMSKLSKENVCEVISVAEMINQSNLKLSALDYIKINKKDILSTPDWSEWVEKNMKLAVEILTKLSLD